MPETAVQPFDMTAEDRRAVENFMDRKLVHPRPEGITWGLVVPVLQKIHSLQIEVRGSKADFYRACSAWRDAYNNFDLPATWRGVLSFINWFNSVKRG